MIACQRRTPSQQHLAARLGWLLLLALVAGLVPLVLAFASQSYPLVGLLPGRIVYTRAASEGRDFAIDIYVADANGDGEERLTNTVDSVVYGSAAGEDQPRWSPDGAQLAFSTYNKEGVASIWRVAATGGTPTPMVQNDGEGGGGPSWQPDGRCVLYAGAHRGGASTLDIRRACVDGTVETVMDTADVDERGPDVSPDGKLIVYQARRPPRSFTDRPEWSLWLARSDGTEPRLLYAPSQGSATNPRWSPDMARVAFVLGMPEGVGTLCVIELATGEMTPLLTKVAGPISWSPDGQMILFHNVDANGPRTLYAGPQGPEHPYQETQYKGLYVLDHAVKQLLRLRGRAGGEGVGAISYQWGYAPDWYAPTATPTPTTTSTPSPTATTTAIASPTATATEVPVPAIFLPLVGRDLILGASDS